MSRMVVVSNGLPKSQLAFSVLLLGEGDFSFSLGLHSRLPFFVRIITTTLESVVESSKRYSRFQENIFKLEELGAFLVFIAYNK